LGFLSNRRRGGREYDFSGVRVVIMGKWHRGMSDRGRVGKTPWKQYHYSTNPSIMVFLMSSFVCFIKKFAFDL